MSKSENNPSRFSNEIVITPVFWFFKLKISKHLLDFRRHIRSRGLLELLEMCRRDVQWRGV